MPFMRLLIFIVSIFSFKLSLGQTQFEKQYSSDVCSCVENKHLTTYTVDNFITCFQEALEKDSIQVMQEYKRIYGDTVFSEDRHFGRDLYERIKVSLIGECKTYAILFDSLRYNSINKINQDSVTIQLKNLDTVGSVRRNKDYYNQKSLLFFQSKMYDSSLANANRVLTIDSANAQAMYFKGWVDEIKGNYDEAIFLYDKVAALTKQDNFLIFSALAKRKKNGM